LLKYSAAKKKQKGSKKDGERETLEILKDPELMRSIRQGEKELREGRYVTLEELKRELGWD